MHPSLPPLPSARSSAISSVATTAPAPRVGRSSGITAKAPKHSISPDDLSESFERIRGFTLRLCEPLNIEDYVGQSMEEASPIKWHLAHTTWFFETFVLKPHAQSYSSPEPGYAYLFNSYYNAAGPMHCRDRRGVITRPTVAETMDYRREVDERVLELIRDADPILLQRLLPLITLGLNHEQQHQELMLTDLKHLLWQNPLLPVYREGFPPPGSDPAFEWISFDEGLCVIGHEGPGFAYDNEGPRHRQFLDGYRLGNRLVTNQEYLRFMEDGGYQDPAHWLSLGWKTAVAEKWEAPLYWLKRDGEWHQFTLHGTAKVRPEDPVCHVSFFEADAFARWAGHRLPTEAEWERSSEGKVPTEGHLAEDDYFQPMAEAQGRSGDGLRQMFGDVWEWTGSSYRPYPGYRPDRGALGEYNGKFMSNQMVLRGGSCATSRSHIRGTYRNFFPPETRWQFSGIRLAEEAA